MPDREINKAISDYLDARKNILRLGYAYPHLIGGNDNIIGRIGEFIAIRFLESLGQQPKKVEHRSNQGYDLVEGKRLTQVKVITSENEKGKTVRLIKPWNQFVFIKLDEDYQPSTIGILTENQHEIALSENPTWSASPVVKLTMLGEKGLIGRYGELHHEFRMQNT